VRPAPPKDPSGVPSRFRPVSPRPRGRCSRAWRLREPGPIRRTWSAGPSSAGRSDGHTQDPPVTVDAANHNVLDPVSLHRAGPRWAASVGKEPGRSQISLLPKIGADYPHIEVLGLHASEIVVQTPDRDIDGDRLVIVGRSAWSDRAGVRAVLPKEGAQAAPVATRQP
jgi:hypothetical protein